VDCELPTNSFDRKGGAFAHVAQKGLVSEDVVCGAKVQHEHNRGMYKAFTEHIPEVLHTNDFNNIKRTFYIVKITNIAIQIYSASHTGETVSICKEIYKLIQDTQPLRSIVRISFSISGRFMLTAYVATTRQTRRG
jgi:dynactin complex subunit